jgi:hypothetical protein
MPCAVKIESKSSFVKAEKSIFKIPFDKNHQPSTVLLKLYLMMIEFLSCDFFSVENWPKKAVKGRRKLAEKAEKAENGRFLDEISTTPF